MDRTRWNKAVIGQDGAFLQSWEWGKLQERLGRSVRLIPEVQSLLISMPLRLGLRYEYAPRGPSGKTLSGMVLHDIAEHTHGVKTIFVRIEPRVADTPEARGILMHAKFREAPDVQPSETRLIDLTKSEEELLGEMEHDTRYAIRAAEKRGVTIERVGGEMKRASFAKFWELFETTNARHGLHAYNKGYYEAVADLSGDCFTEIFLAKREGETIAGSIVAYFGDTAYYLYAASRAGYGKYNAPSLMLWEIVRAARARGYTLLDLWGTSETKKEWKGVTAFKKSFGGTPVSFVGTWDYVYRPFWYMAYRITVAAIRKK